MNNGEQMSKEKLNSSIKTRVPTAVKKAFEKLAIERRLDAADLQREALREYLDKQSAKASEQKAVAA